MIDVKTAQQIVLGNILESPIEEVDLLSSTGRVLRENIYADRPFPPFDRVTMDGICIQASKYLEGQRVFKAEDIQGAGMPQKALKDSEHCLEVMTGAIMPKNADAVIPYEYTKQDGDVFTVQEYEVATGKNIHPKNFDRNEGDLLLESGKVISPAEIGVLASVGKSTVKVSALPKVAVISTGDELVEVEQTPLVHQIRKSNVYSIASTLLEYQIKSSVHHLNDEKDAIRTALQQLLKDNDILILSGGVSKGKFDYLPEVLAELKVEKLFHKVKQRPGKPFWFGKSEEDNTVVFALPGNPVSTYMCLNRYFIPFLTTMVEGKTYEAEKAILGEDFTFKKPFTYFLQVKLKQTEEGLKAFPIAGKGSGDFANLMEADAFLELPAEAETFKAGEVLSVYRFK